MQKLIIFLGLPLQLFAATFTHPDKGFTLEYDATTWEIVAQAPIEKIQGEAVDKDMAGKTLLTLQRKNADDKYRARFSVVVDSTKSAKKNTKDSALTQYQRYATDFLKGQRFTVEETETKTLTNVKDSVIDIKAYQRDFGLTFRQVIALKGEEAYLLTGAARTKLFDQYAPEIEKIVQSFKF